MVEKNKKFIVYILSDSLGETAQYVARAAANQFPNYEFAYKQIPFVEDQAYIAEVLDHIDPTSSLLMYTLVVEHLREYVHQYCERRNIPFVDVLEKSFDTFSQVTGEAPVGRPGLVQRMDESYFKKIEAIEFAIKYDDGKDMTGLSLADLVLLGVSRTSKTPLSMFLAYKGIKVANVPLVPEVKLSDKIFELPREKVVGLTIQPETLGQIRHERVRGLGVVGETGYTDLGRILNELDFAEKVMKRIGCPVIDVSHKAVEETASDILQIYFDRGDNFIE